MRRLGAAVLTMLVLLSVSSCSSDDGPEADVGAVVRLDGSARIPDDEGIATALSRDSITLDGKRTYEVSDDLRSFSTYTRELEPMIGRLGQYVQIGVDDDTMVWMGGVARVVEGDTGPSVFYTGRFREVTVGRFVFTDGTTFAPGKSVKAPPTTANVTVRIDVESHLIVEIT